MMGLSKAVKVWSLHELAPQPLAAWAQSCRDHLSAGHRLVTLFGRHAADRASVLTTALLLSPQGQWVALRGQAQANEPYPSLTPAHPAAQIHERELWEQTGLVPEGHPWLKPVRFEGERQGRMADYPFFSVRGHEVHEVGVGPIHAGVIEPGHFRFMCLGERVHHLEIQLGYQHRGVEKLLLQRPAMRLTPIVESICGDSAIAYAWGHCAAIEALGNQLVGEETDVLRGIALELERVAIHLATLGGLATDIAFLQGGGTYGRLRTAIINAVQRVCGNRFGRGWIRPLSTKGLTEALRSDLQQTLTAFARDFAEINDLMLSSRSVQARFQGTGKVSTKAAQDLGLSGVVARASGVAVDARWQAHSAPYARHPIVSSCEPEGDCWARMRQRMQEVQASVAWLQTVLGDPALDLAQTAHPMGGGTLPLQPEALCVSVVEGTRGLVVQVLETSSQGTLAHYKVQDPSLTNWFGLAMALRDNEISDFPICNKSFDLSYCGNDL